MTNYQIEYKKYLNAWQGFNLIMPSFIEHLRAKRDAAARKKQWNKVRYFEELIQEDIEDAGIYDSDEEIYTFSDADPGL